MSLSRRSAYLLLVVLVLSDLDILARCGVLWIHVIALLGPLSGLANL